MERDNSDSISDLQNELESLESIPGLSDKEAEERFILWYEDICKERIEMLNAEEENKRKIDALETAEKGYRKRIKELENSTVALVKTFEESQSEIKGLRIKYEGNGDEDDVYIEPYDIVAKERNILREKDIRNKEKIKKIKDKVTVLKTYVEKIENNNHEKSKDKTYKDQIKKLEEEVKMLRRYVKDIDYFQEIKTDKFGKRVVITSNERLNHVESENERLKYILDKLKKKNKCLVSKVELLESKLQSIEPISAKSCINVTKNTETILINKKCIKSFLPRVQNTTPGNITPDYTTPRLKLEQRRKDVTSNFSKQQQLPFLRFGLGYGDIYKRMLQIQPLKYKDIQSLSSRSSENISKYMI